MPKLDTTIGKEAELVEKQSFSPSMEKAKGKVGKGMPLIEDDMSTTDFDSGLDPSLDIVYNVIFMLSVEYNCETELEETWYHMHFKEELVALIFTLLSN